MESKHKKWYVELFSNYANQYEKESFTQGTLGEVNFIEKEFLYDQSKCILDIGCGTGRHSIELAKRGYSVEGFDLSENQLTKAKENAQSAGVNVRFFQQDACDFNFNEKYDHAIMICEGAFSLMETDEMNYSILQNAYNSIKPGGKIIFTCLNGLFPLYHSVKEFMAANQTNVTDNHSFDLMTFRDSSEYIINDDDGNPMHLYCNERYYVPSEISWMLKSIGFKDIVILGSHLGAFSREHKLTIDDFEMLVIAVK